MFKKMFQNIFIVFFSILTFYSMGLFILESTNNFPLLVSMTSGEDVLLSLLVIYGGVVFSLLLGTFLYFLILVS